MYQKSLKEGESTGQILKEDAKAEAGNLEKAVEKAEAKLAGKS